MTPGLWGKDPASDYSDKQESADYSSKQNNGKRGLLSLHLSLQGNMAMGEYHSLIAMYVSAVKQTLDHDWYRGRNSQKRPTRGEFLNYGN